MAKKKKEVDPAKLRYPTGSTPKWVWCPTCCQNVEVGQPHTCYDFVKWFINEYAKYLSINQKTLLIAVIKRISHRSNYYSDFIGGEDE